MSKRIISLILTASMLLALGLCACSGSSTESSKKKKKKVKKTTTETSESTLDPDDDPTSDPDADPTTDPGIDPTSDTTKDPGIDPTSDTTDPADSDPTGTPGDGPMVGISMPTKALQRWYQDGADMKTALENDGYRVDLLYADNDVSTQIVQIESMISDGCDVLVIAAIDGNTLSEVLAEAKAQNIPVIAYDRIIFNTDAVSYYVTFDNYNVGVMQGEYIRNALDLDNTEGPYNIEIFTGDPGDNNAFFFYSGAMDVLNPYIQSGKLVVRSGQIAFEDVATEAWRTDSATARMDTILSANYADGSTLDAVLCSNDSTALGVENSLAAMYTGKYPVITGQDCDITNVKNILAGLQSMSVFKDTRTSSAQTVTMVEAILEGKEVPVNDTVTYYNGSILLQSYLVQAVFCDANNYKEILIDSGYYTEDNLS